MNSRISEFAQEIVEAAEQRLRFAQIENDTKYCENGGHIVYTVDPDVVMVFLNPKERLRYARVFSHQSDESCAPIAWHLGEFVFFALTQQRLCLISPQWEELLSVIESIERNALKVREEITAAAARAQNLLLECANAGNSPELIAERLLSDVPELILFLAGQDDSATSELRNVTRLLDERRICPDDSYFEEEEVDHETLYWSFAELPELYGEARRRNRGFHKAARDWFTRLRQEKNKRRAAYRIQRDAEVLAFLQLANQALEPEGRRVVLVTGDEAMLQCAAQIDQHGDLQQNLIDESFADLYLRDIRSYLGEKGQDAASHREDLQSSLDALFSLFGRADQKDSDAYRQYLGKLRKVARWPDDDRKSLAAVIEDRARKSSSYEARAVLGAAKTSEQIGFDELRNAWQEFIKGQHIPDAIEFYQSGPHRQKSSSVHRHFSDEVDAAIQRILKNQDVSRLLTDHVTKTWLDFFLAASRSGFFWFAQGNKHGSEHRMKAYSPRAVPTLRFDYVQQARDVSDFINRTLMVGEVGDWKSISEELFSRDSTRYTQCLVLGVAHAAMGRWKIAELLAQQAIEVASRIEQDREQAFDRLTDCEKRVFGHEAYYLLIQALRHEAKSEQDINNVEDYLHNEVEKRYLRYAQEFDKPARDLRFEHDKWTLEIMRLHFHLFPSDDTPRAPNTELIDRIEKCQNGFSAVYRALESGEEQDDVIHDSLLRRTLVNILQLEFMRAIATGNSQEHSAELLRYTEQLQELIERRNAYFAGIAKGRRGKGVAIDCVSYLVKLIMNMSILFFVSDDEQKERARKLLTDELLTDENMRSNAAMSYDEKRFVLYRALVASK